MKPRLVGIDVSKMDDAEVFQLVNSIRAVWPAGPGQQFKWFEDFKIRPTDVLRMVLGVPTAWLTPDRIVFGNAMHQLALGRPAQWTRKPGWAPRNSNAVSVFKMNSVLDRDFMSRFTITDAEWDADVFRSSGFLSRLDKDKPHHVARAYLALRLFGFTEAEAFFVAG